ncbi:MAG TPA: hypothetical protein VLA34_05140 [Candidatus Krumholzibacterium sp.]|nr:hypothetical protein [Candidatus Krumholzibacterium sp.]
MRAFSRRSSLPATRSGRSSLAPAASACLLAFAALCVPVRSPGSEMAFKGQLSGWHIDADRDGGRYFETGLRYIPGFDLSLESSDGYLFSLEVSADAFFASRGPSSEDIDDIRLYRLKLRAGNPQAEIRLGLQQLNFGPAFLLRSLMWFESYDPRDPLGMAEGVYGIRFRYDASNNSGLWLWALYGNDSVRGLDILPSTDDHPELGGRFHYPVPRGELGATFHSREVGVPLTGLAGFTENRYALDGRWDIFVGAWFEAVLKHRDFQGSHLLPSEPPEELPAEAALLLGAASAEYTNYLTLGVDYTVPAGNGLYILAEHMATGEAGEPGGWHGGFDLSALMFRYPLGYVDDISAITFYNWELEQYSQHVSWRRTWDDLILDLSLFRYPSGVQSAPGRPGRPAGGSGAQLTIMFNH